MRPVAKSLALPVREPVAPFQHGHRSFLRSGTSGPLNRSPRNSTQIELRLPTKKGRRRRRRPTQPHRMLTF
jgi:hypothetical protein